VLGDWKCGVGVGVSSGVSVGVSAGGLVSTAVHGLRITGNSVRTGKHNTREHVCGASVAGTGSPVAFVNGVSDAGGSVELRDMKRDHGMVEVRLRGGNVDASVGFGVIVAGWRYPGYRPIGMHRRCSTQLSLSVVLMQSSDTSWGGTVWSRSLP
jgi:hypothetical protein